MTIPEILAALERFGGTARPTEPGLLVLTLPAETTRERLDEVTDAVCAMGLPEGLRVGVTRESDDPAGDKEIASGAREMTEHAGRLRWLAEHGSTTEQVDARAELMRLGFRPRPEKST